jgi:Mg2+-importing ATPase
VQRLAFVNAALETGIENPLDAAIVTAGERDRLGTEGLKKIDEIPYDFIRKRLTIVVEAADDPQRHWIITKGAFANVLDICSTVTRDGTEVALDDELRERLADYFRRMGEAGLRVLAVATARVAAKTHYGHDDEAGMSFAGYLLFRDPPKPEVQTAIRDLAVLGIRIKIISGDNRYVTAHLATTLGLDARAMLTGEEIDRLRDESLWHLAERTELFVEVDPQQKERIVRALQRTGHAVGYLGDGINDAPALHAADIGISVDQAVDVARESADVILLQHDLDVLRGGVEEGRRTFANTLKYICITTSANFGNMVSMALATPLLPFLPLAAKQILLNNFLSDLPSVAISTDSVDAEQVARVQRWHVRDVQRFMLTFGLLSTVFDLLTFVVLLELFAADQPTFQTAWFMVSVLTELAVLLVLRTQKPAFRSVPSGLLLVTTAAVGIVSFVMPYLGPLASVFDFVPLPWHLVAAISGIVAGYVVSTEAAKVWFFGRRRRP